MMHTDSTLKTLYFPDATGGGSTHFGKSLCFQKAFLTALQQDGTHLAALTRKRRCGLTVTRTFLTFFFSWKSRAEQTAVSTETEGSFVPSTVQER